VRGFSFAFDRFAHQLPFTYPWWIKQGLPFCLITMPALLYSPEQTALINHPLEGAIFLEGPAGSGKTSAAVARLVHLLEQGVPAETILLLLPQRSLAGPYHQALRRADLVPGGLVDVATVGGLARRMIDLFWPAAAGRAGFAKPDQPPTFLTLETAQYYLAQLVKPLLEQGFFDSLTINRHRLYSQILDNLNKAAVVGFPYTQTCERLTAAWIGERTQLRIYAEAQECAQRFRQYCLDHNLLDFSLQMEVFRCHLWTLPVCRDYLMGRYQHLIVDNLEEDTPVAHDLLLDWLPNFQSALFVYDLEAGFRIFLGADPDSADRIRQVCQDKVLFSQSMVTSPGLQALGQVLGRSLSRLAPVPISNDVPPAALRRSLIFETHRFRPQEMDWVAARVSNLVHIEGVNPAEIAVLAPFLTDTLRFSLVNRLGGCGISARSLRPSRGLREEPATLCLLTLAALAHPHWGICPGKEQVIRALMQAIEGLDLVRAKLLTEVVYRVQESQPHLGSFDQIKPEMGERITYQVGVRYQRLQTWLTGYRAEPDTELDTFLSRLFGEVLSQPGFGFHNHFDAGGSAARLVESVRKFRWTVGDSLVQSGRPLGLEYLSQVQEGLISAQYLENEVGPGVGKEAILLAPAYTFLLSNHPVDYQFWLDVGGMGWWERLNQPLTHPFVLSRNWPANRPWSDVDDYAANQETLYRVVAGLIRRCRKCVYLGLSDLNEQGLEQQGPLLRAVQQTLRRLPAAAEAVHV
jgi:hypothetical protein